MTGLTASEHEKVQRREYCFPGSAGDLAEMTSTTSQW